MSSEIPWRIGVEIELLAPSGRSRLDLAAAIAEAKGGSVHRFFHPQSEPSKVPGMKVFHNLTLGYEVVDTQGTWIASCVDDLTLQADLKRETAPKSAWYRILSDDERLLRLIQQQTDAELPLEKALEPLAALFGTSLSPGPGGMKRVNDVMGATVAMVTPLPGERERPCELVTAPMDEKQGEQLDFYLELARSLGFTAPQEGATHLHFDATALQSAGAMANLIQLLWTYGEPLKQLMKTNPKCRRLGPWPKELIEVVSKPDFRLQSWSEARAQLRKLKLTKYCDFNIMNCLLELTSKNTIEVRVLPVWLESQPILEAAELFVSILQRAVDPRPVPPKPPQAASAEAIAALRASL